MSGAKRDRPEFARLIEQLRDEDVAVVTRLDRLARSTKDLLDLAEKLNEAGAGLRSLAEPWADTTSRAGRMVLTVFAGIAEFERALIHQRTSSGASPLRRVGSGSDAPRSSAHSRSRSVSGSLARGRRCVKRPSSSNTIMPRSTERSMRRSTGFDIVRQAFRLPLSL